MDNLNDALDSSLSTLMEASPEPDSILILNDDCLHLIFSYIINIRERLRLMRVCKRFSRLIKCGLKTDPICLKVANILYQNEKNFPVLQKSVKFKSCQIFAACHKIIEFHNEILDFSYDDGLLGFTGVSSNGLSFVEKLVLKSRYTRRLCSSSWTMESIESDSAEFAWLLTRCTQLKTLHVHDFHLDWYLLQLIPETVVNLYLIDISVDLKDFEKFLSSHGPRLLVFKYSRRTVIPLDSDRSIVNLTSTYCPNLESLELNLSYPELVYFGSFKNLRYLSIEGSGRSIPFYEYVFQNCPNLTHCKLTFKVQPSKDLLTGWKSAFPKLQDIQVETEKSQYAIGQ